MNARSIRLLPVLLLLAPVARAASYPVRHLYPNDALMALSARIPELNESCRTDSRRASDPGSAGIIGTVEIVCESAAVQAKIQPALEAIDVVPPTHRFHVAVLRASRKPGPDPELPPSELKALSDFKKVMTFKSFQLEAETLLQSDREAQAQLGGNYAVELVVDRNDAGVDAIGVRRFQLRAATPVVTPPGGTQTYYPNHIETSFSIKKGETIVLGTSLSEEQARVVLVTALP